MALSTGTKVGIGIGIAVGIIVFGLLIYFVIYPAIANSISKGKEYSYNGGGSGNTGYIRKWIDDNSLPCPGNDSCFTDENGDSTYELDSIFGNTPIKLSVYENKYFLRDFDPALELDESLVYFTDRTASDGSVIADGDLEGELLFNDDAFEVSDEQIILEELEYLATLSLNPSIASNDA